MSSVCFLTSKLKSVTVNDTGNRPHDVSYFTVHSLLYLHSIDPRSPNAVHQFEFSFRLPHNSPSSSVNISMLSPSVVTNQSSVAIFDIVLSRLLDSLLNQITATEIRHILSARRNYLPTSVPST